MRLIRSLRQQESSLLVLRLSLNDRIYWRGCNCNWYFNWKNGNSFLLIVNEEWFFKAVSACPIIFFFEFCPYLLSELLLFANVFWVSFFFAFFIFHIFGYQEGTITTESLWPSIRTLIFENSITHFMADLRHTQIVILGDLGNPISYGLLWCCALCQELTQEDICYFQVFDASRVIYGSLGMSW